MLVQSHGDQAAEPVDKSGGKLAAALGMDGPIEKPFVHVKNKNLYCRALLLASYAIVCSRSDGKPREQFWRKHRSPNIWCSIHVLSAAERGATLLLHGLSLGRLHATEHLSMAVVLREDCREADPAIHRHAAGHAHMVYTIGVCSVFPSGQCLHASCDWCNEYTCGSGDGYHCIGRNCNP